MKLTVLGQEEKEVNMGGLQSKFSLDVNKQGCNLAGSVLHEGQSSSAATVL